MQNRPKVSLLINEDFVPSGTTRLSFTFDLRDVITWLPILLSEIKMASSGEIADSAKREIARNCAAEAHKALQKWVANECAH